MKKIVSLVLTLALLFAAGSALAMVGAGNQNVVIVLDDTRDVYWEWTVPSDPVKLAYQSVGSAFIGSIDVRIIVDDNTYILNNSKVSADFAATSGAMSALDLKWEKNGGTDCYVTAKDMEFDDSYASAQKNVKVPANSKLDHIILTNEITGTVTFKCWVDNL